MTAVIALGEITWALAGLTVFAAGVAITARAIRAWLYLRRATVSLLANERAAREFWAVVEANGLARRQP